MKIVFMGTPDFAASALKNLIEAGHEITAVVTQPDKPKGRSSELLPPPVKVCAMEHDIPVMQPRRIKAPEAVAELRRYPADVYVVAAFGQILSQEILDIPRYGCLNIHASLLPKYRGAAPIQQVIIDGEEETGITIMQMDAGIDTGDMLYRKAIRIEATDNYETLHDKLAVLGGQAIVEALALLEEGGLVGEKQNHAQSSHVSMISKSMGEIDFSKSAVVIDRLIRGMTPWPSAYTFYHGKQMKIWRAVPECEYTQTTVSVKDLAEQSACDTEGDNTLMPGTIVAVEKDSILVLTGEGCLRVFELQLEGKKKMTTHDFLLGVKLQAGEAFGR